MDNFFWTGYCNRERITATSEIEKIVSGFGFITDFKQFSDISISLKIELEERNIDGLYEALSKYLRLDDFDRTKSDSIKERIVFLNLTFTKGTGNLEIVIPAVPG